MSLHTDALGDLESGASGPQPYINNIQLAYTLMELRSLEINEEVKKVVVKLSFEYMILIHELYDKHLEMRSRNIKARAVYLTTLAIMSLFFAVIQVIFIHFTTSNSAGFTNIPRPVGAAFDFFRYSALALNMIGAVFALTSARTLFRMASNANTICEAIGKASNMIWHGLNAVRKNSVPRYRKTHLATLSALSTSCQNLSDNLLRLTYVTDFKLGGNCGVLTVIFAGMIFFFVSLFIFIIVTHRLVVWVPWVVLVGVTTLGLLVKELRCNPSVWKGMPPLPGWLTEDNLDKMQTV